MEDTAFKQQLEEEEEDEELNCNSNINIASNNNSNNNSNSNLNSSIVSDLSTPGTTINSSNNNNEEDTKVDSNNSNQNNNIEESNTPNEISSGSTSPQTAINNNITNLELSENSSPTLTHSQQTITLSESYELTVSQSKQSPQSPTSLSLQEEEDEENEEQVDSPQQTPTPTNSVSPLTESQIQTPEALSSPVLTTSTLSISIPIPSASISESKISIPTTTTTTTTTTTSTSKLTTSSGNPPPISGNPRVSSLVNNGGTGNKSSSGLDVHKYRTFIGSKLQSTNVKDDPMAEEMIFLPKEDLSFTKVEPYHRIISTSMSLPPGVPTEFFNASEFSQHIKTSIETFNAPRKTISKNYDKYKKDQDRVGGNSNSGSSTNIEYFNNDRYECDIVYEKELLNSKQSQQQYQHGLSNNTPPSSITSSRNSGGVIDEKDLPPIWAESSDELHFEYQVPITPEVEEENQEARKRSRLGFFKYYKPDYNWGSGTEVSLCNRTTVDYYKRATQLSVLIEFKGLVFLLGEHEPFYCSMFLYDSVNKCRLSETFHFDFNPERLKLLVDTKGDKHDENTPDYLTQCRHVLVSLPVKQQRDIWIVVRINKIMQGDPDLIKEPYTKLDEKEIGKSKVKVSTTIQDIGKRLGRFHQSFSITALPLTNENGGVKSGTVECDLYRQVSKDLSDVHDLITDLKDSSKKKKIKTLLGAFTCIIHKTEGELPSYGQRLDPSYNFIKAIEPYNQSNQIDSNKSYNNSSSGNPNSGSGSSSQINKSGGDTSPTIMITPDCTPPFKSVASNSSALSMSSMSAFSPPTPTIISVNGTDTNTNAVSSSPPQPDLSPALSPRRQLQHSSSYSNSIKRVNTLASLTPIIPAIREIQSFSKYPELIPHYQQFNNLYIYPDTVGLAKAHGRNISIKIEIREDDIVSGGANSVPLKFIYGKSSCQRFTSVYYTETHYHTKNPLFFDEIKIKLPPILPPKLHILFTFYHVVCKVGKRDEGSENVIGFSAFPLYREKKFVDNGTHSLQFATGPPKDKYLQRMSEDYVLLESGKSLFKFDLKLMSSLFPQNTHLNKFLLCSKADVFSDKEVKELTHCLNQFALFDPLESIKFFPVIMNHLLFILCNRESTIGSTAIKALLVLLTRIQQFLGDDSNIRVPFLSSYITHVFDNPSDAKVPVHTALCTRLVLFLMRKRSNDFSDISNSSIFSFSWFIFDLIIKSIGLYKLDGRVPVRDGATSPSLPFFEIYDPEFIKYIPKLVSFGLSHILGSITSNQDCRLASDANNNLALFIRDLFGVFDRGVVIDLLFTFINDINQGITKDPQNSTTFLYYKFDFLKIICDYEHYINLNIPTLYSINNIQNLSGKINDTHPISGILIREVLEIIFHGYHSIEVRSVAFTTLNTIITKHDYDQRYQSVQKKERIASIYFPLILELIDHQDKFNHWCNVSDINEKRLFISCCLWVLKNISKLLLKQWFNKEVPQRLNILFEILCQFAHAFEYQQIKNHPGNHGGIHHSPNDSGNHFPIHEGLTPSFVNLNSTGPNMYSSTGSLIPTPPPMSISGKLSKDVFMKKSGGMPSPLKSSGSDSANSSTTNLLSNLTSNNSSSSPSSSTSLQRTNSNGTLLNGGGGGSNGVVDKDHGPSSPQQDSSNHHHNQHVNGDNLVQAFAHAPIKEANNGHLSIPNAMDSTVTSGRNRSSVSSSNGILMNPNSISAAVVAAVAGPNRNRQIGLNESILASEANLIILDFVEDLIKYQYLVLKENDSPILDKLFQLFITLLKKRQSHRVTLCLFASLRSFVFKFRNHFFSKENQNNYCNQLCCEILRYCNFPSKEIRAVATSFFYSMVKHNNQVVGNFGRMKIQATIALSNLANSGVFKNDFKNLERSFSTISRYSYEEGKMESGNHSILPHSIDLANSSSVEIQKIKDSFSNQIQKMSSKLSKIIRDTVRANLLKANSDPETIHELYSEIASGYSDTPIIRIDWLNILVSKHIEEENYFEAAVCKLRIALLVIEYLKQNKLLPCEFDTSLIDRICPGIQESVIQEDEGVCTSPIFSLTGLTTTILLATNQFRMGDYFEYSIFLYKLLMPLYEKNRDFANLSDCHRQITDLYKEIIKAYENKSRMLGRYYRVGFYGDSFEDLDGQEFIYKEPKLTHLFALSERLKTFYSKKFNQEVIVFPDSGKIERSNLDSSRLFLQITSLKPYFTDDEDERSRPDYFEKHTLLKNFVFITPFTLTGRTQGSITEQFHRKTILTIENTAPNMLKRYLVVSKKEIEISPIENSIETIQQRNHLLELEINQSPPNIKTLQGVLQGSVLLQVNAGALEICRGFLANQMRPNWSTHHVENLANECCKFLKLCKRALDINKNKIQINQISFHQELELGYSRLYFKMDRYIRGEINNESDELAIDLDQQNESVVSSSYPVDGDESSMITDLSYDDDISIKESSPNNIFDSILPNLNIGKKKSMANFLTIKEDKKVKRGSAEFLEQQQQQQQSTNSILFPSQTPRSIDRKSVNNH